nr:MAG TPA: hypothetical protein [Bacteriophage sp.]
MRRFKKRPNSDLTSMPFLASSSIASDTKSPSVTFDVSVIGLPSASLR